MVITTARLKRSKYRRSNKDIETA